MGLDVDSPCDDRLSRLWLAVLERDEYSNADVDEHSEMNRRTIDY